MADEAVAGRAAVASDTRWGREMGPQWQRTSGTPLNLAEPGACVDFSGSFTGTAAAVFCAIRYSRMGTGPQCEQPYMVLNLILQKDDMSSN